MIDVMVGYPGATAEEVEHRVATPLEKLLYEIDNVDFIYSISQPSGTLIIVRFLVGTDPTRRRCGSTERSPRRWTHAGGHDPAVVKPRTSTTCRCRLHPVERARRHDRAAQGGGRIKVELTRHPRVAQVGARRQRSVVRVDFDRERLASFNVSILRLPGPSRGHWRLRRGATARRRIAVDVAVLSDPRRWRRHRGRHGGRPVYLKDVRRGLQGAEEPRATLDGHRPGSTEKGISGGPRRAAVTLARGQEARHQRGRVVTPRRAARRPARPADPSESRSPKPHYGSPRTRSRTSSSTTC